MKIPLWARNRDGKLEPFPYHLLSRLSDGTVGFSFPRTVDHSDKNRYFGKFRTCFEWNPVDWNAQRVGVTKFNQPPLEYRLKKQ